MISRGAAAGVGAACCMLMRLVKRLAARPDGWPPWLALAFNVPTSCASAGLLARMAASGPGCCAKSGWAVVGVGVGGGWSQRVVGREEGAAGSGALAAGRL